MVEIDKLTNDDVGRWVMYIPDFGPWELGRIKSWHKFDGSHGVHKDEDRTQYIFVVYKCGNHWDKFFAYTAAATDPNNLVFADIK